MGDFNIRPIMISAERTGFFKVFKEYLMKKAVGELLLYSDLHRNKEIIDVLFEKEWPVFFIEHSEPAQDAFLKLYELQSHIGLSLFPVVLLSSSEYPEFKRYGKSCGAWYILQKPMKPTDADAILNDIEKRFNENLKSVVIATALKYFQKDNVSTIKGLEKLSGTSLYFARGNIALARMEMLNGDYSKAEKRLKKIYEKLGGQAYLVLELADFYRNTCQSEEALIWYQKLQNEFPRYTGGLMDVLKLYIELDDLNNAGKVLEIIYQFETLISHANHIATRMLYFTGLKDNVENLLRGYPDILRQYLQWKKMVKDRESA